MNANELATKRRWNAANKDRVRLYNQQWLAKRKASNPVLKLESLTEDEIKRFVSKAIPIPESGCWIWTGALSGGYGSLRIRGFTVRAHRLAYEIFKGPIPSGLFACHKCDIRCCINPDHLFLGTNADNVIDALSKGKGWVPPSPAKINRETAEAIRAEYATGGVRHKALGLRYGLSASQIGSIVRGESWT